MANRYWVNSAGGNWNDINNWATSSDGTPGASVPGVNDVAIFDGAGGKNGNCTLDIALNVTGFNMTSGYSGVVTQGTYAIVWGGSGFTVGGGSFAGGSGAMSTTGNGAFTISGSAAFKSTSNTLSMRYFVQSGTATFDANGGKVLFGNANSATITMATNLVFWDMEVAQAISLQTGRTIRVDGTLTLTSKTLGGTGTINAKGAISIAAAFAGSAVSSVGDLLLINGASAQSFTVPNGARMPQFNLNQAATTITFANGSGHASHFTYTAGTILYPDGGTVYWANVLNEAMIVTDAGGTFTVGTSKIVCSGRQMYVNPATTLVVNDLEIAMTGVNERTFWVYAGKTVRVDGTLTLTTGRLGNAVTDGVLNAKGAISIAATFLGLLSSPGVCQLLIDGAGDQSFTVPSGAKMPRFKLNNANTTITFADGSYLYGNSEVVAGGWVFSGTVTIYNTAGGPMDITIAAAAVITTTGSTLVFSSAANSGGLTTRLLLSANLTIANLTANMGLYATYALSLQVPANTLIIAGTLNHTTGSLVGAIQVNGDCIIGASANGGTATITFGGSTDGIYTDNGGTKTTGTVTVNKTGTGKVSLATAMVYNAAGQDLTITAGTLDLAGFNLTVNDDFTISSGATLKLKGNETITVTDRFINSGAIIQYYDSAVVATMSNFGTAFPCLTFGASKTHNFTAGATYTVAGTLASDGTSSTKSVLRSTTPTTHWNLTLAGTSTLAAKVDVQDSDAAAGVEVQAVGSLDSGNNHHWFFGVNAGSNFNAGVNAGVNVGVN